MSRHVRGFAEPPTNVDWTALVTRCERDGIPVTRVDSHGRLHLIRSVAQLTAEWELR